MHKYNFFVVLYHTFKINSLINVFSVCDDNCKTILVKMYDSYFGIVPDLEETKVD